MKSLYASTFRVLDSVQHFVNEMYSVCDATWYMTLDEKHYSEVFPLVKLISKRFKIVALCKRSFISFPGCVCVWYKMKTSGSLPPSEGSLLGKSLLEEEMAKLTHRAAHTRTHAHTHCFPTEGTLTEAALPVTVAAIILQALSTDRLLQVSTLITTSLSTHILSMHTDAQEGTLHTHKYTYCTYS